MRTRRYLKSLRVRIVLAITSLALISACIYSCFAWFIYDVSDDRLFNWYALSINKEASQSLILPTETPTRFVVVGTEREVIASLHRQYGMDDNANLPERLADYLEVSNTAKYEHDHVIFDAELQAAQLELQIVVSPWKNQKLYVVYDISGFAQEESPDSFYTDKFVLYVLIPLALLLTFFAFLLSMFLTKGILKPLTRLAQQVTSVQLEQLSKPLTGRFYPDEVGELADTFNQLINKIDEYIQHEKRFSREVSHELRTPTTSLTMALDLLEQTPLNTQQKTLFARMQRANKEMTQLINTFLWLAKNKPEHAQLENVHLHNCVAQVLSKLSYLSENKPVEIINQVNPEQYFQVNAGLLDIVLSNLLRNALQYTHQGSVKIINNETSLTVIDTGLGIPANELSNITEAFYSLQPDGVGLGMSIVQRVISKLGWQLLVESEEGKGTKMTIVFA